MARVRALAAARHLSSLSPPFRSIDEATSLPNDMGGVNPYWMTIGQC